MEIINIPLKNNLPKLCRIDRIQLKYNNNHINNIKSRLLNEDLHQIIRKSFIKSIVYYEKLSIDILNK